MRLLMIFRQYDEDGLALADGYVVERIAHTEEEKAAWIAELKQIDYELESTEELPE